MRSKMVRRQPFKRLQTTAMKVPYLLGTTSSLLAVCEHHVFNHVSLSIEGRSGLWLACRDGEKGLLRHLRTRDHLVCKDFFVWIEWNAWIVHHAQDLEATADKHAPTRNSNLRFTIYFLPRNFGGSLL